MLHVVVVVVVPDVVVDIEVEQWPGLASRLRDDEVVEGVVLRDRSMDENGAIEGGSMNSQRRIALIDLSIYLTCGMMRSSFT